MFFICALLTFFFWGVANIFYKLGNTEEDEGSHYKTGMMVGFVMGIQATLYLIIKRPELELSQLIMYLPISLCYIASMIIGYKGLKYLEVSIAAPLQNTSGIVTAFLLILIFHIVPSGLEWVGLIIMLIGVILITMQDSKKVKIMKFSFMATIFPLMYALLDGIGTFFDGVALDNLGIISADAALISYEYTFFIYAIILFINFRFRKGQKFTLKGEKNRMIAAILETAGQCTYVYAIASHAYITAPIMASFGILSIILSRIFLKEKLPLKQYISISFILLGITILGISEGLS